MKRNLTFFVALIMLITIGCSVGLAPENGSPTQQKKLSAGTEGTMYPWTYVEDGKVVGLEADIMAEIGKRTGYEIELKPMDWSGLFGNFVAKPIDTVANIVTITDERKQKYFFTQPYLYNPMVLATKSTSDIKSLEDINGRSIVIEVGSSDEIVLKELESKMGVKLKPVYYEGISVTDVANGRVDLWIGGEPSVNTMIEEGGYDLRIIGRIGSYQEYGYPFLKNEKGQKLCTAFDNAISEMKKDGTLKNISEKWLKLNITEKPE